MGRDAQVRNANVVSWDYALAQSVGEYYILYRDFVESALCSAQYNFRMKYINLEFVSQTAFVEPIGGFKLTYDDFILILRVHQFYFVH